MVNEGRATTGGMISWCERTGARENEKGSRESDAARLGLSGRRVHLRATTDWNVNAASRADRCSRVVALRGWRTFHFGRPSSSSSSSSRTVAAASVVSPPPAAALLANAFAQHASKTKAQSTTDQTISTWDGELHPYYRGLLEHKALLRSAEQVEMVQIPSIIANNSGCIGACSGHGQCQALRGGADGRWTLRCACHPGWSGAACSVRDPPPQYPGRRPSADTLRRHVRRGHKPLPLRSVVALS